MYNLLIIGDNVEQIKNMINIIGKNCLNTRIYNISLGGDSIFELLKNCNIDIIILDLDISGTSGKDIIKFIEKQKLYKYLSSIIILSRQNLLTKEIKNSPYLFTYILKNRGIYMLVKNLNLLTKSKERYSNLNNIINIELKKLKFDFSHIGTTYLKEVIINLYKLRDHFDGNLKENIYSVIAKKYNKKVNTIYCDVKQAVKSMLLKNDRSFIAEYFNYDYYYNPKINEIIFTILNKILKTSA